jgi:hypothetical protein
MPTLKNSLIDLDPKRYRPVDPIARQVPINLPPEPPIVIRRSPVMISSLPAISTDVDGIARQFYGGQNAPTRRLILP